jgi:hypothetical protein
MEVHTKETGVKCEREDCASAAPIHFYAHLDRKGMMEVRG